MFVLTTIADTVCIPPSMFVQNTMTSVHTEIEKKYPNRVIMDVGLVICRYGPALEIGDGVCVAGDGSAHHEVVFRLVVFRPFVEEVCVGNICESNEDGVRVSLGEFFHDIYIPAYWMLNPSHYDKESGLWVWTPKYDDDDDEEEGGGNGDGEEPEEEQKFDMEIGSQIRFKVKAINFTQVTNTAKGVQATTTSTASGSGIPLGSSGQRSSSSGTAGGDGANGGDNDDSGPVRKRSTSIDLSDSAKIPASMHITASICEDGLGLVSWWEQEQEEEEGGEEVEGEEGQDQDYDAQGEDNEATEGGDQLYDKGETGVKDEYLF